MIEPSQHESELLDLLSAVWDDRLDPASRARLEVLLTRDEFAGIELLTSFTRLHVDLEWLVSSNAAHQKALETLAHRGVGPAPKLRGRSWQANSLVGLAAGFILAGLSYLYFGTWHGDAPRSMDAASMVRAARPLGRIVGQENAVWGDGLEFREGEPLLQGQTIELRNGTAQISMGFGADLVLQSPCRATMVSDDLVRLENGKIAVRAADWATGFRVETNDLLVTDVGTRFAVYSGANGLSEVHVLEGLVIAHSLNETNSTLPDLQLKSGEAIRVNPSGAFDRIAVRRESFLDKLEQFRPLRPIEIWNTGVGLNVGDKDPHWIIIAGDERVGPFPQPATICGPDPCYGDNDPERSQWISVDDGTTTGVPARTKYTFETTFDLTGFDLRSVRLSGLVLADNGIEEVWLNGKRLAIAPWNDWFLGVTYFKFHPIEISSGFVPGVNRLAFVVNNETVIYRSDKGFDLPNTPNAMALRVEWRAFGQPAAGSR